MGASRSWRGQRSGSVCWVGGRAWCRVGAGLGGGSGRRGAGAAPESLTATPRLWAEGRRLARGGGPAVAGTPVRCLLLQGREGLALSWGTRGATGPRGLLLRSSNEWAPGRLRGGAERRGKTSLESRLWSHDGGRGGERDEWRKRVGDGLGVNLRALPLCDQELRLGRQFQSPPSSLRCCPRQIETKQKRILAKSNARARFLSLL